MALSLAGPALPHLREQAGVGIGVSGFVLAGQSFGYILGSLAAGGRYDRGHGHRLLLGAGAVAVAAVLSLAALHALWSVVAAFVVIGFSSAGVDVGGNTLVVWSQPTERVGSTLNALHLCFGVGALVTPLLVAWSLAWTDGLAVVAVAMAATLAMVALLLRPTTAPPPRPSREPERGSATRSRRPAFALLCTFFFVYVGVEVAFAGWISTYAEQIGLGGADAPGILASVFWAGFAAGRVVAIYLARRAALATMLLGTCVLATAAALALALGDTADVVVWIATGAVGFALGPQYATMLALGDERLQLSGSATSLVIASSGVGGLTLPVVTGWTLDRWGASLLPWTVAAGGALITAIAAVAIVSGRQRPPLTSMNAPVT
jgi:FHS family Na+ dependent glucose MFS transporter 1